MKHHYCVSIIHELRTTHGFNMLLIKILVLVFGFIQIVYPKVLQSKVQNEIRGRIIGGKAQDISQASFMLQLNSGTSYICGASLIKEKMALTAAHCTTDPNNLSVRGGSSTLTGGKVVKVAQVKPYKGYNPKTMDGDIAILILKENMSGTNIKTIEIYNSNVPISAGATVEVLGWGITHTSGQASFQLQKVDINIVSPTECRNRYKNYATITNNMICAAAIGKDSCSGDSGGPLLYNKKIAGIVSFGIGCANINYPGVYTNVYNYRQFIIDTMRTYGYVM